MKYIGKFKVSGILGKGGMGKVFKIEYPVTGKIAAMKYLEPAEPLTALMGEKAVENLFVSEAKTLASIRHPNVVEILDFDWFNGRPYYIMEFYCNNLGTLMGESYETEQPSRIIGVEISIGYMLQVLEGLACLHLKGVIHRDIKPFNILLDDGDTVKICDFGLSKLRNETFRGRKSIKVGSPYYASPEQEQDPDGVDQTADLYSAGVMFFRMLTGCLPEKNFRASTLNSDLDRDWDDFFKRALAVHPDNRFQDADAMARAIKRLCASWAEKKQRICSAPRDWLSAPSPVAALPAIRHTPAKISRKQAMEAFDLNPLMGPRNLWPNDLISPAKGLVVDRSTGLMWQTSGTRFPGNWQAAQAYIARLNKEKFHGQSLWRLPTVPELLTLFISPPQGMGNCMDSVFDARQNWLWSADRATFTSAWYANIELGFIAASDFSGYYHVKAVCKKP